MKKIFCLIISVSLFSCSSEPDEKITGADFQLPDSLFAFKDIDNTLFLDELYFKPDESAYTDSTTNKAYISLDSAQKMKLLAPIIGIDPNYIVQYMGALFVSKHKMIGEFTPITIYLYGDDYSTLHYILLDKTLRPVSSYVLNGGENGGPADGENGALIMPPVIHSFFKGDKIYNYCVTETLHPDSIPLHSQFDSVYYESIILPDGKIQTKKLDSVRYEKSSTIN